MRWKSIQGRREGAEKGDGEVDGGESHGGALKLRGARSSSSLPLPDRRSTENTATDTDEREKRQKYRVLKTGRGSG